MFIVAVTRWGSDREACLPELAELLGVFPYDLRVRLNAPLPTIVARLDDRSVASTLMAKLRAWGHGAVGCDLDKVTPPEAYLQVRDFGFEGARLRVEGVGPDPRAELAADEVLALVHAVALFDEQQTQETSKKRFSASRAVLSGGLVMTRTEKTSARVTNSEAEGRLYLIRRDFQDPLLFCQHSLRYTGLGEAMERSSFASFGRLVEALRAFAPAAHYDKRLVSARPKSSFEAATRSQHGRSTTSTVTSSNLSALDLAVYLLVVGLARGQL